jgi:hypothetical protein
MTPEDRKTVEAALSNARYCLSDLLNHGVQYANTGERHQSDPHRAADAIVTADRALALLRAEPEKQEPVAWMRDDVPCCDAFIFHAPTEPPNPFFPIPLYTHPQ